MIKAITFDLWETLIADSAAQNDLRTEYRVAKTAQLLLGAGAPADLGALYAAHEEVWRRCEQQWVKSTDLPFAEQVALFLDLAQPGLSATLPRATRRKIEQAYADAVLHYPPQLIPGAAETLAAFKRKRLKLALICNTGRSPGVVLRTLLGTFGIVRRFNAALFSDETIVRKPDPRIFAQALDALGVPAAEAVHVGDSAESDIAGAAASGLRAVWIRKPGVDEPRCLAAIDSVAQLPAILQHVG
ncbi:MAG TPA: HAD family hydrolase [Candidatus Edwardsbacteria bacterium]|nr:HAD family hydrolase [Candidatus Edwardsbacteria bacterium]